MKEKKRRGKAKQAGKSKGTFLPQIIGMTGGVVMSSLAFWFFQRQADRVVAGKADALDIRILHATQSLSSKRADEVMRLATYMGTHIAVGTGAGLTALMMMKRHKPGEALTVVVSTGGAMAINTILKNIFRRQRPQQLRRLIRLPKSHSFPSGHSLLAAATFPIIAHHLVYDEGLAKQVCAQAVAGVTILSVGVSRVYFGVHFPSDVLAGFAAGLGWLGLTSLSLALIEGDRAERG
ncbi:MAG: phosphatase PAP2 family protein [Acidobacteriota bacterium]